MMTTVKPERAAPVALFVYARPVHTRRTLEALAAANGARETDVFVYADGARGVQDRDSVEATREVIRNSGGFRSLTLIARDRNFGLAANIISGVSDMFERHERLIVLEDDVVPALGFLDYMNAALNRYAPEKRVWHISGWNYPINPEGLPAFFFWRTMNCWGWATWADRWAMFRKEPERLLAEWSPERRREFNLDGAHDFFSQVEDNAAGRINTWAIFWYATIFEHSGLCLNPAVSFVRNIGLDGSGEHCGPTDQSRFEPLLVFAEGLPALIEEETSAVSRIRAHLQPAIFRRVTNLALRSFRRRPSA